MCIYIYIHYCIAILYITQTEARPAMQSTTNRKHRRELGAFVKSEPVDACAVFNLGTCREYFVGVEHRPTKVPF